MSKEILQSKIKKWIGSVSLIQQQSNRRFEDKDKSAFINCIKSVLSGRDNPNPIAEADLSVLETYIKNSQSDDFKAALENFYVLLKKNNHGLKEFYEVIDDQNFTETLQKICDSYDYEQEQKNSAESHNQTNSDTKTQPSVSEDAGKWFDSFLNIQENISLLGKEEVECFTLALGAVLFGDLPVKDMKALIDYWEKNFDAAFDNNSILDLIGSIADFSEISMRRLSNIDSIKEFRTYFNNEELDGINHFVNENLKIIEDREREAKKVFKVTDGWIKVKDCDGNTVTSPSKIYTNSQYVYYDLKYEAPASMTEVEIKTRLISPDGSLKGKGSSDYTMQRPYRLDSAEHILNLNGWGNDNGSVYVMPGEWTAEFFVNDVRVYTLKFNVEQAPAPSEPTIRIDSLRFDNCDIDCNIITKGRLPINTQYINPVIKYTRLRNYGTISLAYRIIRPNGEVQRGASSPIGVTNEYSFVPNESGERVISGWGAKSGTLYSAGKYGFELLQGNKVIYTTSFYVGDPPSEPKPKPKPTPKPTVTPPQPSSTNGSSKGKKNGESGCGCFAVFVAIMMVLGGYWYWDDIRNWIFGDDKPKHDYVQVLPGIWNGTMNSIDVTLEIDSILNDSVVSAEISGQFSKVRTQKLKGYIGTNDSIYLDGASSGKYFNGKFKIGMSDDGREIMHGLFFDKSSGDTIRIDAHKDEIPRVRPAKSNKSTNKKSDKSKKESKKETNKETVVVEAEAPGLIPETKQDQERRETAAGDPNFIYKTADVVAEYPGGQAALMKWLSHNVRYPEVAQQNGVQGRVVIGFVVEKDGSISGARVLKSVDRDLNSEAIRVVQSMPRWNPGKINGEPVRMHYTLPVNFKLQKQ